MYLATTHGGVRYTDVRYERVPSCSLEKRRRDFKELITRYPDARGAFRWAEPGPQVSQSVNSAAILLYEAMRQHDFQGCGKAVSKK